MKALVTGASGFVGQILCQQLQAMEHEVCGTLRNVGVRLPDGVEPIAVGEIGQEVDWTSVLRKVEVVIHLAARVHVMNDISTDPLAEFRKVNVAGTERLARSAAVSGVKRLVYVSSIKVNGEETAVDRCYTELDASAPQDAYGLSKLEAEQALHRIAQETGLEVVIVRPPLVYGPGVKGNFAQMLRVLGWGVPLPLASIRNRRSLVYLDNLVDALILCVTHPAAAGQTYLVSDGEDVSTPDLLRALGEYMGRPARLFPCPVVLLRLAGKLTGRAEQVERLAGSLCVDSGKIRRELGWMPPFSMEEGLRATAWWYRERGRS